MADKSATEYNFVPGCTYMFGKAFLSMMKPDAGESISISCLIFPLFFSRAISRSGTCHRFNRSVAASNSDWDPWDPAAPPGTVVLHPAGAANLHVGKPRFIGLDVSDGADLVADRAKLDDTGLYSDALHPLRTERDR